MIVIAFLTFAILIVAWLMAPNGDTKGEVQAPAPSLKMSDARA